MESAEISGEREILHQWPGTTPVPLLRRRTWARIFALSGALTGGVAFAGWAMGEISLASWFPKATATKPIAAVAIMGLGVGAFLATFPAFRRVGRYALPIPCSIAVAFGLATLVETIFGIPLGVDKFFFPELVSANDLSVHPGRMSPLTATSIVLLGFAIPVCAGLDRAGRRVAIILATIATTLAFASLLGYAYRFPSILGGEHTTHVAFPAALGLTLVGATVLLWTAEGSYMSVFLRDTPAGRTSRRLVGAAVLVPFFAVWVRIASDKFGILPTGVGDAFVVLTTVLAIVFVIWWNARELQSAHEQVVALQSDLEKRVVERTQQLEESNRELEAFNYSVSHDLRNPLHIVHGYSDRILHEKRKSLDEETTQYVREIKGAAGRMKELTDSLLRLSRLSKVELKMAPVELGKMAQEIIERLRTREPARTLRFQAEGEMWAMGDPALLRVVLENLLGNAWKFTRNRPQAEIGFGGSRIGGTTTFYIRDNGIGFEQSEAERLFRPFRRLGSAAEFEGSGVGLATVARIVQRHGGRVFATGVEGIGATFSFTLPSSPLATTGPAARASTKPQRVRRFVPVFPREQPA